MPHDGMNYVWLVTFGTSNLRPTAFQKPEEAKAAWKLTYSGLTRDGLFKLNFLELDTGKIQVSLTDNRSQTEEILGHMEKIEYWVAGNSEVHL